MNKNTSLQLFPNVFRAKQVRLKFNKLVAGDTFFFFDYDKEVNESVLKGIRCEIRNLGNPGTSMDLSQTGFTNISTYNINRDWVINLVNKKGEKLLNDYPLNGLINSTNPKKFIRRVNMEIDLSKSYIRATNGTSGLGIQHFLFTLYYKQKV